MTKTTATIRMYNQENLGDCFLLRFNSGDKHSHLLIDFGSYTGNTAREREIAEDIKATIKEDPLHIAVTHQHEDHLSGFVTAGDILKDISVKELWLSFLDSESSKAGQALRDLSKKYWQSNDKLKKLAKKQLGHHKPVDGMLKAKEAIDLFAENQSNGKAYTNLLSWAKDVKFFEPGQVFDFPGLPKNTVKVYVLGPPTDFSQLKKMDPGKEDAVHGLLELLQLDTASSLLVDALEEREQERQYGFPFSKRFFRQGTSKDKDDPRNLYAKEENEWRQIDYDWLNEMGRLSLHMDDLTNNTSLVLAFELVESGKVLLFAGDAQIGNWRSWFNVKFKGTDVTAEDLLKRTIFYKAGHHSSHNATLLQGLDLMNEKELVIFIPVNEKVSTKQKFLMLKPPMMKGYNRKAEGRVVRSDKLFHEAKGAGYKYPFAKKLKDFPGKITTESGTEKTVGLYIEHTIG